MLLTYLTRHDYESNKHRFYQMHVVFGLFGEWALVREWGRIGSGGQIRSDWFETKEQAIRAGIKLKDSKLKKGYESYC